MTGEGTCAFGEDSETKTPVWLHDESSQWHTANHRKRTTLSLLHGDPMQQDSQVTQAATEGATPPGESTVAPVFIAAMPSQEDNYSILHDEDDVNEEETQIRMTNSEEQEGVSKLERKIFEETVLLPLASAASSASQLIGDAGTRNGDDDSNMSDDMLEQDRSIAGLSEIAAFFRPSENNPAILENRIYKPRASLQALPALLTRDDVDSSGGETEIEGEPAEEEVHVESQAKLSIPSLCQDALPRLAKSASYLKATIQKDEFGQESIRRELSMPEKTTKSTFLSSISKRDQRQMEAPDGSHVKTKRSRPDEDEMPLHCSDHTKSMGTQKVTEMTNDDQHKHSTSPHSSLQVADKRTLGMLKDKSSHSDGIKEASSHSALRSPCKAHTSRKCAAVIDSESTGSQSKGGSIRIILTGLEPTAAICKKIKLIAGAVYESNIEKATHVIAPQNQLKRTVKLLCGISCCTHILGKRWLDESARAGAAVDEQANCLHDEEAETKWQFNLKRTMYGVPLEQRQRLLAGYSVFITNHKSVLPPVKDLIRIVVCAGGKASSKGKPGLHDVVITSEMALTAATVRKQLVNANSERIYSPELILSSVLRQCVELDKHRLELPIIGKSGATKRRN